MLEFNFQPTSIRIYREFPVRVGEINLFFENKFSHVIFVYRRAIIRDSSLIPVAEGLLIEKDGANEESFFELEKNKKLRASLVINSENMAKLVPGEEYNAIIEYGEENNFAWTDKILANLDTFAQWDENSDANLLDEIAALLPISSKEVPFHVRQLLNGEHMDLCMDFGTSFSACALSIDPNKSHTLACFKKTDPRRDMYYTHFPAGEGNSQKSVVPTAMALREIISDSEADWLCGFDAAQWAKRNPEKGHFITDVKDRLRDLDKKERCFDQLGRAREFSNEEIVTEYLKFLVDTSKRYFGVNFKNIHITLPVASPERQRKAFEHILKKLGFVNIKTKLDEARAPLYHFLSGNVEKFWSGQKDDKKRDRDGKPLSYLIIDCGGGSTDATLLRGIELLSPKREGGGITMKTDEPLRGGNDKFGGVDLTALLFEYIKMRVCEIVYPEIFARLDPALETRKRYLIDNLISQEQDNIFWELYNKSRDNSIPVDQIPVVQHNLAYEKFEEIAKKIEELFPTNEKNSSDLDRATWEKIHRNRSAVWQLAESLKITIFADNAPKTVNLLDLPDAPEAVFYMRENVSAPLEPVYAANFRDQLVFHSYELDKLFRPIIFKEISRIHRQLNIQADLSGEASFFNVRFVGQTTNIPLFNEALSFFVPRSMIEEEDRAWRDKGLSRFQRILAEEKKICCVTGAANFLSHISRGCLKNANQVATTRALKNFCRFGSGNQPLINGVYNWERKSGEGWLIEQNSPMDRAYGAVVRDLADDMTENFGTKYDENIEMEGTLNFRREDMSHPLSEEEQAKAEERWGELFHGLGADPDDPAVLIQVEQFEEGSSPRYEFRPYYWDAAKGAYMTTPEPLKLNVSGLD